MRVLFATGTPASYMAPPCLGDEQIVCGPDWKDERGPDGRWLSLRTPLGEYDFAQLAAKLPASQQPDVVVCLVDASWRNLPRNWGAFRVPRVLLVADTHHMGKPIAGMLRYAASESFDRIVFLYDRHHLPIFRAAGLQNLHWFPGLTFPHNDKTVRSADREQRVAQIAFVGQAGRFHPRRARLLTALGDHRLPVAHKQLPQRAGLNLYGSSLIGFNASLNGDLNLRIFEALASGSMLLTDRLSAGSGLPSLWREGQELITYKDEGDLVERARHYLDHPAEAREIGRAGARWFKDHFGALHRRSAFLRLAMDGQTLPEFELSAEAPLRISYPSDRPGCGSAALEVYESIQELHQQQETVRVSLDATVPGDFARLCETLPRVLITRDASLAQGERPDWRVVGASVAVPSAANSVPRLWCWDLRDAADPVPDRLAADGLASVKGSTSVFVRPETAPAVRDQAGPAIAENPGSVAKSILVYTDESTGGGVAHYNHAILGELVRRGWRVFGAQPPNATPLLEAQKAAGITHRFLSYEPRVSFTRSFVDTADAERVILPVRPDLIYFSDCSPVSNVAAKHVAISNDIPFVSITHSGAAYLADRFPNCLGVVKKQFARAREAVTVSNDSLAVLRHSFGLAAAKGVVIHNGRPQTYFAALDAAERSRIRAELGVPHNAVVCFTSARFDQGKGYQYQFLAIKYLQDRKLLGPLYFVWAGDGPIRPDMEAEVKAQKLPDRVRFLGERWDVPKLLGAADIFVFTSSSEAMPLCVLEAMAQGLPVAATSVGGIPEELGDTGHLLPDPNIDARNTVICLVEILKKWAADPTLRQTTGREAKLRAERLFREETMIETTLALLDRAAGPTPQVSLPGLGVGAA